MNPEQMQTILRLAAAVVGFVRDKDIKVCGAAFERPGIWHCRVKTLRMLAERLVESYLLEEGFRFIGRRCAWSSCRWPTEVFADTDEAADTDAV